MLVSSQPRRDGAATLRIDGPLRAPVEPELRSRILRLLRSGERRIVLDLAGVSRIDAAGVGELIRVYRMAVAANGACRVVHATAWVRDVLERVGLYALLAQSVSEPVSTARTGDGLPGPVLDGGLGDAARSACAGRA